MRTGVLFCTVVGAVAAAVVAACGTEPFFECGFDNDASPGIQGTLAKAEGDGAVAAGGAEVELRVSLEDVDEETLCDIPINWTPAANSGSVTPSQSLTLPSGLASALWTLGTTPGTQTVTATVDGAVPALSVTFTATVTAPTPTHPLAEIGAYNGTSDPGVTVTMQTPYDGTRTFGPLGANTQEEASLQVEVGVAFQITATVGAQSGSVTCVTTSAIIPDPGNPDNTGNALVAVFTDGGVLLTCNGGWVAAAASPVKAGARPR
jgi:hypothetical protein